MALLPFEITRCAAVSLCLAAVLASSLGACDMGGLLDTAPPTATSTATDIPSTDTVRPPSSTATSTGTDTATATPSSTATATATQTAVPTPTPAPPLRTWGTQFAMDYDAARHSQNVEVELPRARAAGIRSVRTYILWRDIEPTNTTPEGYDWAETDRRLTDYAAAGMDQVLVIAAYPRWAMVYQCGYGFQPGMEGEWRQFVRAVAERYRVPRYRVVGYEIGNEVDGTTRIEDDDHDRPPGWAPGEPTLPLGGCWGDRPAEYASFLRLARQEIKDAHPWALVSHGGLAFTGVRGQFHRDFLDRLLAEGGGDLVDYVGYHWFPDLKRFQPGEPTGVEKYREVRATMGSQGVAKPVWLTETYRLTVEGDRGSEVGQVEFLTKELPQVLAAGEIKRVYWYGWADYAHLGSGERQRGLVRSDRSPKPALAVLPHTIRCTNGSPADISTERVVAYRFTPASSTGYWVVMWSRDGSPAELQIPAAAGQRAEVVVPATVLAAGEVAPPTEIGVLDGRLSIPVGAESAFVTVGSP